MHLCILHANHTPIYNKRIPPFPTNIIVFKLHQAIYLRSDYLKE